MQEIRVKPYWLTSSLNKVKKPVLEMKGRQGEREGEHIIKLIVSQFRLQGKN